MKEAGNVMIVGASRGLGLGMAEEFLKRGWRVIATERTPSRLHELSKRFPGRLEIEIADVADYAQIKRLRARLHGRSLDVLFANAGIGDGAFEKIGEISDELFVKVMITNTLAPLRVIEKLKDLVAKKGAIGVMSSELGSVEGNASGGFEVYRGSKAALNTLLRSVAARDPGDQRAYLAMAPGWVRTNLGGPNAALSIEESVPGVVDVIIGQRGRSGVRYLNYQGRTLPW